MGKLIAIAIRNTTRAQMQLLKEATVSIETGIENDFRGKPGKRQVTVLSIESWQDTCKELGKEVSWTARRANLLIQGINLMDCMDEYICIDDVVLKITGSCTPCARMDESVTGLKDALDKNRRGGVLCSVIKGGNIRQGSEVETRAKIFPIPFW